MPALVRHPSIEVRRCEWGWGVFATTDIAADTVVEEASYLDLPIADTLAAPLRDYVFRLLDEDEPDDRTKERRALVLGLGSLFNHSHPPNIEYTLDSDRRVFCFTTNRDVRADEQLCVSYGEDWWEGREDQGEPVSVAGLRAKAVVERLWGHSPVVHSEVPLVAVVDGFASPAEVAALIDAAKANLGEARLDTGEIVGDASVRTGRVAWIHHTHDADTLALAERIAAIVGIPRAHAEAFQVVRYHPGERYVAHYDGFDMSSIVGAANEPRGGQRLATALLYLRPPTSGGATNFPTLELDVAPEAGRMLLFWNVGDDPGVPHPLALHSGEPVTEGEKWIANLWFRERAYRG